MFFHTVKCFKNTKWLNRSIWPMDKTLTVTIIPGQNGPRNNGNDEVLYIPLNSRTVASPPYAVWCHIQDTRLSGGFTPLGRYIRRIQQPLAIGLDSFICGIRDLREDCKVLEFNKYFFILIFTTFRLVEKPKCFRLEQRSVIKFFSGWDVQTVRNLQKISDP